MMAGIAGVALGSVLSHQLKAFWATADPLVCGIGLLISAPLLLGTTYAATRSPTLCFVLLFLGQLTLNLNWAIVCDIVLVRKDDMWCSLVHVSSFIPLVAVVSAFPFYFWFGR